MADGVLVRVKFVVLGVLRCLKTVAREGRIVAMENLWRMGRFVAMGRRFFPRNVVAGRCFKKGRFVARGKLFPAQGVAVVCFWGKKKSVVLV